MPVVMGTAGHIDHGKTSLVRALTGVDCDRLSEEKSRGITIELGFAYLDLPNGDKLSIIDVPGHERFVKNMVSGAAGIDFVALVIAADEGIMPQTREHMEICSLLGLSQGLVVLTKIDMVDSDWLALVQEDIKNTLKGSFLEKAPFFPVSAQQGQGLSALKDYLIEVVAKINPKRRTDLPRLPIDRVFTMRGHGTVVTGTLISGQFKLGDEAVLMPAKLPAKIRSLQSHGKNTELAFAGYRTAVNLSNLEVAEIQKGDVLSRQNCLFPSATWVMLLTCLPSSPRPLRHRAEIHFHHGAREVQARLFFFDRDLLQPGEQALCQVQFSEPMVGVYADRAVIRSFAPLRTVAGASLVYPLPLNMQRKHKDFARKLEYLQVLAGGSSSLAPEEVLASILCLSDTLGASFAELRVLSNLESGFLEKQLQGMSSRMEIALFDRDERRYLSVEVLQALSISCLDFFARYHAREKLKTGLSRSALASAWGKTLAPKLFNFMLERLLKDGKIVQDAEVLRMAQHSVAVDRAEASLHEKLLAAYTKSALTPLNIKELFKELKINSKEAMPIVKLMQEQGELVKINEDIYYAGTVYQQIKDMVLQWFETHENLDLAALRDMTELSRKYLIALLDYFDKSRLTLRVGDSRILRK